MFSCAPKGENISMFLGCLSFKYLCKVSSKKVFLVLLTRHTETHRAWSAENITHTVLLRHEPQRPVFAPDFDVCQWWGRGKDVESETWRSNVLDMTLRLLISLIVCTVCRQQLSTDLHDISGFYLLGAWFYFHNQLFLLGCSIVIFVPVLVLFHYPHKCSKPVHFGRIVIKPGSKTFF